MIAPSPQDVLELPVDELALHVLEDMARTNAWELEAKARRQFLIGEYENAIFVSMKAVEIRVRQLAGFRDEVFGTDFMTKEFNKSGGSLTDPAAPSADTTAACNCHAKESICQTCRGEGWLTPLLEGGRRPDGTGSCPACSGLGGQHLPHASTWPVMEKHSGLQHYAPQVIRDDGKVTFYSTGDALADPDK
ncbi:TIGR02391 family protein [Streptomyces sp. NPDC006638]|uniref:TIGR02391 family protein n=1 Tax=Streptomyces sp. NPDC006638 TaxID=3157183 RepID=UPI0033BE2732